jgi:hypothetical protein
MNGNPVGGDFISNMSGYVHQVAVLRMPALLFF